MAINVDVLGNTQPLEAAVQSAVNRIRRRPIKITVDDKGATQPLGNMRRSADEFSKSMEAANARIIAFGASMAIINGVADAFKGMVRNVVEVEKALADINVVMGLSAQNLEKFGDGLFTVAKETGQAFKIAADAATEYARQGLSMEESLKRTKDALILTRLTGMDSANAVKSLTAAMNTYGNQIKDTTQLVSKFAAVDVKFAVSAEDFADAIARTGAAARGAGVDIDELIGLVTAAQQQTARGGKVIGNSFKTIFTRIGRTDTLNQLENLGIAVRDIEGNTLGAKRILTDLANTFDSLTEAQKAQIAQTVGGVFQINVLKAVLGDAAKQNGILANATQISAGATDEAITKNEQLRQTMAAMATETGLAIKEASAKIGEIALAPGMEKILNVVKSVAEGANNLLGDGESAGGKFANGFLKGLGNIITGPGLVVIVAVFGKLFLKAAQYARESLSSLIGVTTEAQKQKAIQTSLVNLFGQNAALSKEMLRTDISRTEKEKIILALLKAQVAEANVLNAVSKQAASTLYRQGFGANLAPRRGRADGHIPNFAEREQAAKGGYAAGNIREMSMPGQGSVIYNSAEKVKNFAGMKQPAIMPPLSSKAGKNYQQAFGSVHGFDPYAGSGFIPNFNKKPPVGEQYAIQDLRQADRPGLKAFQKVKQGNPTVDLGTYFAGSMNRMGVVLGVGKPTKNAENETYSQPISDIQSKKAKATLAMRLGLKIPDLKGKTLRATLPTYTIGPVDESDIEKIDAGKSDEVARTQISGVIKEGLTEFAKGMHKHIFKDVDKPGFTSANVMSHVDNGTIGNLYEAAMRTAIGDRLEPNTQESFDFRGQDASVLSRFFGSPKDALEAKYTLAAAKTGGIPKKILNYISKSTPSSVYESFLKTKPRTGGGIRRAADGYIPNFADPLSNAINREKGAGVPVSQIRVGSHQALMNKGNPLGLGVTNTTDEPNGLRDVFGANGYVPNYSLSGLGAIESLIKLWRGESQAVLDIEKQKRVQSMKDMKSVQKNDRTRMMQVHQHNKNQLNFDKLESAESMRQLKYTKEETIHALKQLGYEQQESQLAAQQAFAKSGGGVGGVLGGLGAAYSRQNTRFGGTTMGRAMGSSGVQMAMMMGLPMAAGFMQDSIGGTVGNAAGGALNGVATGASMGMMFGPLGTAIGAAVGGLGGFAMALIDSKDAVEKKAEAERKVAEEIGASLASVLMQLPGAKDKLENFSQRFSVQFADLEEAKANKMKPARGGPTIDYKEVAKAADLTNKLGSDVKSNIGDVLKTLPDDFIFSAKKFEENEDGDRVAVDFEGTGKEYAKEFSKSTQDERIQMFESLRKTMKREDDKILAEKKKEARGVIIQLDLQKTQIMAQQAAAMKQLEIKDRYSEISDNLKNQVKLAGSLATDQFKAQNKYLQALNKAEQAYKQSAETADSQLRMGILSGIRKDTNIQSVFKTSLGLEDGDSFQDITDKVGSLSGEELKGKLQDIATKNKTEGPIREAILQFLDLEIIKRDNILNLAEKQQTSSESQAEREKNINMILAGRKTILDDLKRADRMADEDTRSAQKIRGLDDNEAKARRLNAVGAGFQSAKDKERFQILEKEFELQSKLATLEENRANNIRELEIERAEINLEGDPDRLEELQKLRDRLESGRMRRPTDFYKHELEELKNLELAESKRVEKLEEIKNKIENANNEHKKEIESLNTILALEKERLKQDRLERTGTGSFGRGFDRGMSSMKERIEYMDYELGQNIPGKLADGLATAMTEAANGAKSIGDALEDAALNFLSYMQQAMMQKLAMQAVGALGFSQGGGVKKYSSGGNVPAMVTNGEYVMGREAVKKYGGGFMHSLNARGKIPNYSMGGDTMQEYGMGKIPKYTMGGDTMQEYGMGKIPYMSRGGEPGSALAANFGGGESFISGRNYQSRAMSGFFYSGLAENVGLQEDAQEFKGILQKREEERRRREMERQAKKAKRRKILGMIGSIATSYVLGNIFSGASSSGIGGTPESLAIPSGSKIEGSFLKDALAPRNSSAIAGGYNFTTGMFPQQAFGIPANSQIEGSFIQDSFNSRNYLRRAHGGMISGKSGIDQIPAMLSEGEYVIKASSARQMGKPMLDRINAGKFYEGGVVGSEEQKASVSSGLTNNINISVNIDKNGNVQQDSGQTSGDGASSDSDQFAGQKISERIKTEVVSVLMEEKRPGGILSE